MSFFQIEWKMTVPNAISLSRLALLPLFAWLYLTSADGNNRIYWAAAVLVISGLTDMLDGLIARKFNQISELGKLLDPIADKLTQIVVVVCMTLRNAMLLPLLIICLVKELCQAFGGLLLLYRGAEVRGARWYGKISTFVFYGAMTAFALWRSMPYPVLIVLIALVAVTMLFAFFRYMRDFLSINRETPKRPD